MRMTMRSAKGDSTRTTRKPMMKCTAAERDDARAAQCEHDRQREQYERATRKRRHPQTAPTAAMTTVPPLRYSSNDSTVRDDEMRDECAPDENARARASAAARTQDVDDYIVAHRNANTSATYASAFRQFAIARRARDVEDVRRMRSAAAAIDINRPNATGIALYLRYIVEVRHATAATMTLALAGRRHTTCAQTRE